MSQVCTGGSGGGGKFNKNLTSPSAGGIINKSGILDTSQKFQWNQASLPTAQTIKPCEKTFLPSPCSHLCAQKDLTNHPSPTPFLNQVLSTRGPKIESQVTINNFSLCSQENDISLLICIILMLNIYPLL